MDIDSDDLGVGGSPQEREPTLLLVDDEKNILSSLRRVFRSEGYEILMAQSGVEALERLKEYDVDLVISDMRMPEMDGAELLATVTRDWPHTVRILLTGYADLNSTIDAINKGHIYSYFSKPWDDNEIRLTVRRALEAKRSEAERRRLQRLTQKQNEKLQELNDTLEQKVQSRTEELNQTNMFLELAYKQLKESYYDAIPIFANFVQLREGEARGHSKRVGELARDVAEELDVEEEEAKHIYFAGLLHDIGKLALTDELIETPWHRMTPEQKKVMRRHPTIGASVLMGLEPLQRTALFIRQHHESLDGTGYPDGLRDGEIELGSRIVMACNEYDDLRRGELLGDDLSMADAMEYMRSFAGKRYDTTVLEALLNVLKRRESGTDEVHEHRLGAMALQPGMRLSRDLISPDGVLVLSHNHVLNEALIEKIQLFERDSQTSLVLHVHADSAK